MQGKYQVGDKVGSRTLIEIAGRRSGRGGLIWRAKCECGSETNLRSDNLSAKCKHCGAQKGLEAGRAKAVQASRERVAQIAVSGTKRCHVCHEYLPVSAFAKCAPNPDGFQHSCRGCSYFKRIKHHYGLSREAYLAMHDVQGGKCKIAGCGRPIEVVDHCHDTGKVRGLLCQRCNKTLTKHTTPELLEAAARYLKESQDGKRILVEQSPRSISGHVLHSL